MKGSCATKLVPLAILGMLWSPYTANAQDPCFGGGFEEPGSCRFEAPRWAGELATLSANGLIGALTGGMVQHFRGGSFQDGFVRGALGGAIVYSGKRIASEGFSGAGLLGRGVAAVGSSGVRNAGAGAPFLSVLTFPLGPLWLDLEPSSWEVGARVDPAALAWTVYAVAEPELELDWGETLSSGTPVFLTDNKALRLPGDTIHAAGTTNAGVVFLADVPAFGPSYARRHSAHERIHVIQEDQLAILWTEPLGDWALSRSETLGSARSWVVVNLSTEILRLLSGAISEHGDRPWELESIFLAR